MLSGRVYSASGQVISKALISIVHCIVNLYFWKWPQLKVAADIFTEKFWAVRERHPKNLHVFQYWRLFDSEGKIFRLKWCLCIWKRSKSTFIKLTWFWDVHIVVRNHKKDWDLYTCKYWKFKISMRHYRPQRIPIIMADRSIHLLTLTYGNSMLFCQ